jgi:ParB family chromosome partitioning protein
MSKKKRFGVSQALTRGLSETIHVVENNVGGFRNVIVPLSRIELDPDNPRKLSITFEDVQKGLEKNDPNYSQKSIELERLKELAATIQSSGIINPIVVYKRADVYRVVAGERRCLASILAGKTDIEARTFNEKPNAFELKLLQWFENTAREDLTLSERMGNVRDIINEYQVRFPDATLTASLIKEVIGLSLPQASYYLTVLNAPSDVQAFIDSDQLKSLDKAAIICGIEDDEIRRQVLEECLKGSSLKDLRKFISEGKKANRVTKESVAKKRGREVTRVNMGFTMNTEVVQTIVKAVLDQTDYRKYSDIFSRINWNHYDQSSRAFKKLIEILEQETARLTNE